MITLTLPLDNAEALLRGSDLLVGLAKDARAKEADMRKRFEEVYPPKDRVPVRLVPDSTKPESEAPEFDTDGLPWDERIHSSNRKLTAQGVWQRRRNVTDELYDSVVAELRGSEGPFYWHHPESSCVGVCETREYLEELMKSDGHVQEIGEPVYILLNAKYSAPAQAVPDEESAPDAPATPPPPPPPPASDMTFAELIKEITENQVNPDTVLKAVQSAGLPNVGELFNRPDLIPQVARELGIES